jgi:predicted aspartyl protease
MGRKYVLVTLSSGRKSLKDVKAFIDTGADVTILSTNVAKKLGIKDPGIRINWTASDGNSKRSPVVQVKMKTDEERDFISLEYVILDDAPMDVENKEEVIMGLDYLQKAKKTLCFDD